MPRLEAALVPLLAAALAAPPVAGAQWRAPTSLTGDVPAVFRPQVAFSGGGDAVVAYGAGGRFAWARARAGQDAFTTTETTTTDPGARLLTYATSRILVVSQEQRGVSSELRVRFGSLDGGLGRAHRPAPGEDASRVAPAIDIRGDAVVAYVQNVRRGPAARWSSPTSAATASRSAAAFPAARGRRRRSSGRPSRATPRSTSRPAATAASPSAGSRRS